MEDTMLPEFHNIFTTKHYVPFKIFGNKIIIFKQGKKRFQSGASVISKRDRYRNSKWFKVYFKVGQLLQSGTKVFQSGTVISKWAIISKWDITS